MTPRHMTHCNVSVSPDTSILFTGRNSGTDALWRRSWCWMLGLIVGCRGHSLTSPCCTQPCISLCQDLRMSDVCILAWGSIHLQCYPVTGVTAPPPDTDQQLPQSGHQQVVTHPASNEQFPAQLRLVGCVPPRSMICYFFIIIIPITTDMCPDIWLWFTISQPLITAHQQHSWLPSSCSSRMMFKFREEDLYLISAPVTIFPNLANETNQRPAFKSHDHTWPIRTLLIRLLRMLSFLCLCQCPWPLLVSSGRCSLRLSEWELETGTFVRRNDVSNDISNDIHNTGHEARHYLWRVFIKRRILNIK